MTFENRTEGLSSGSVPSTSECQTIAKNIGAGTGADPDDAANALKLIANPGIRASASNDLQAKMTLLTSCLQKVATQKMAKAAQTSSSILTAEFKKIGVS